MKKHLNVILIFVVLAAAIYYFFFYTSNPVKKELSQLQDIAQNYKSKNGNFGIIGKVGGERECFSGNTFVKSPEATAVLSGPDVENISCVFATATGSLAVDAWSVTIVKGDKAYCEDSTGVRMQTPGLTTRATCIAQ
jgi:hypothetical protein